MWFSLGSVGSPRNLYLLELQIHHVIWPVLIQYLAKSNGLSALGYRKLFDLGLYSQEMYILR